MAIAHVKKALLRKRTSGTGAEFPPDLRVCQVPFKEMDRPSLDQPQTPTTGINAIIGRWPGDESEEEILAALEKLS